MWTATNGSNSTYDSNIYFISGEKMNERRRAWVESVKDLQLLPHAKQVLLHSLSSDNWVKMQAHLTARMRRLRTPLATRTPLQLKGADDPLHKALIEIGGKVTSKITLPIHIYVGLRSIHFEFYDSGLIVAKILTRNGAHSRAHGNKYLTHEQYELFVMLHTSVDHSLGWHSWESEAFRNKVMELISGSAEWFTS